MAIQKIDQNDPLYIGPSDTSGACIRALYRDELHEQWEIARRQILLKRVTPSLNQAYAMIIEDEIQHTNYIASVVEKLDQVAMNVHKNQEREYYKAKKCDFCHYTGHTKDNCYKLIGYPNGWKQRRKSGDTFRNTSGAPHNGRQFPASSSHYVGQHKANNATYDHFEEASTSQGSMDFIPKGNALIDQEYRQILELLKKDANESKQINMKDFKFNRLSVSKITKELSCFVSFYPGFCVFQELSSGRVKVHAPARAMAQGVTLWHKRLGHPSSQVLRLLKCLGYALVLLRGDKFEERVVPAIFIGYSKLQKVNSPLAFVDKPDDICVEENVVPCDAVPTIVNNDQEKDVELLAVPPQPVAPSPAAPLSEGLQEPSKNLLGCWTTPFPQRSTILDILWPTI
ncbi:hypothetical protein KY289_031999 [Solanum tuberosum]|nr:hypothetical protein KY289_031999 [Solanum tuberosum]